MPPHKSDAETFRLAMAGAPTIADWRAWVRMFPVGGPRLLWWGYDCKTFRARQFSARQGSRP